MITELQPGQIEQGYEASGRQSEDLALAVRRISEFARKYRAERDEYRTQVWALEGRVRELEQELAEAIQHYQEVGEFWNRSQTRAERWKEAARAYRDVLMTFYHPRNLPYMLRLGRKYRKAKA